MNLVQLKAIIRHAGGGSFALDYANDLLVKVRRVIGHQTPAHYLRQFSQTKDAGDLRGRLLEINLIDYFAVKNVPLRYEVKQGKVSGDIDLLWHVNGFDVYIEIKMLGQGQGARQKVDQQLNEFGISVSRIADDTSDVMRIQHAIIEKATLKKFEYPAAEKNINLIALDVSELQLGAVDIADCVLAALGSKSATKYFGEHCGRDHVLGLFESPSKTGYADWATSIDQKLAGNPHPYNYIHGVIFLFREPRELAALSYNLESCIAWNENLIDENLRAQLNGSFHKIIPFHGG